MKPKTKKIIIITLIVIVSLFLISVAVYLLNLLFGVVIPMAPRFLYSLFK